MDERLKGRTDRPDNDKDIIMWKYDGENSELISAHYLDGEITPVERWVYDEGSDYDGSADNPGMVYLDSTNRDLEEEIGHPTFGEALEKWPCWEYNENDRVLYQLIDALDAEIEDTKPFVRCQFYSYYGSYFINDDPSGMTDDEIEDCEAFLNACSQYIGASQVVDVIDNDNDFGYVEIPKGQYCKGFDGVKFLPGKVCTYILKKDR